MQIKKLIKVCYLLAIIAGFVSCENPFLPPTGEPPLGKSLRSTPQGVVQQLMSAYKAQRLDLYMELFSEEFRFYVSPVFAIDPNGYQTKAYSKPCEPLDSSCRYVKQHTGNNCFYYWTFTEEKKSHDKLFQTATQIEFTASPGGSVTSEDIRYIVDNQETTSVEVVMQGGAIIITGPTYADNLGYPTADQYSIDIGEQVFYLARDPNDSQLWVIKKWFDLGTANGMETPN